MNQLTAIKHIESTEAIKKAFPILQQLRVNLTFAVFMDLYNEMYKEGYRLLSLEVEDEVVVVAGINIMTNLYNNKFLYVYDLVTKETERSKGYGEEMMAYLHRYAKEQGCSYINLESALHRVDAHRFYEEKMGYEKYCYTFRYSL